MQEESRIEGKQEVDGEDKNQEVIENFINLEDNPDGDNENESAGTKEEDESTENVENREETTMAEYWNPQRVLQFCIELECVDTIVGLFEEQLLLIDRSEVEKSKILNCISGFRTAFMSHLEKFKKMKEEASSFSTHGRNKGQETTENEEHKLTVNDKNHEEERTTENLEENPERMEERRRGVSVNMEERETEKAAGSSSHDGNEEEESTENANNHEEQRMPEIVNSLFQLYIDNGLREAKPIKRPFKKRR